MGLFALELSRGCGGCGLHGIYLIVNRQPSLLAAHILGHFSNAGVKCGHVCMGGGAQTRSIFGDPLCSVEFNRVCVYERVCSVVDRWRNCERIIVCNGNGNV